MIRTGRCRFFLVLAALLLGADHVSADDTTTLLVADTPTISKIVLGEFTPTKPGGSKSLGQAVLHLATGDTVDVYGKAATKKSGWKVTLKSAPKTSPKVKVTFVRSGDVITAFKLSLKSKFKDLAEATLVDPTCVEIAAMPPLEEVQFPAGDAGMLRAGDDLAGVLKTKVKKTKTTHSFITVGWFHKATAKITLAGEPATLSKIKVSLSVKMTDPENVEIEEGGSSAGDLWTSTGGPTGGMLVLSLTSAGTLLASDNVAVGPCILRSTDDGATWEDTTGGDRAIGRIHEGPTGTLYVLSNEILKSTDDGQTWSTLPSTSMSSGGMLAVSLSGHLFHAGHHGLYRSKDDGASWEELTTGLPDSRFLSVHAAPSGVLFASGMTGPYRSTDGGDTWSEVRGGLGASVYTMDMAFPASGDIVFCYSGNDGGVFLSTDGGLTWSLTSTGLPSPWTPTMVHAAPNGDLFAASGRYGVLYRSTDGGATWASSSDGIVGTPSILSMVEDGAGALWAASSHGLHRSTNGGANWVDANDGVTRTNVVQLACDDAGYLYALREAGLCRSADGGAEWSRLEPVSVVFTVGPGGVLVAGEQSSSVTWHSSDHGVTWTRKGHLSLCTGFRCLTFHNSTLYAAAKGGVFKSTDSGATWDALNTGLPAKADVWKVVAQPDGDLFAAVCGGTIYRSADGGSSWTATGIGRTSLIWYLHGDRSGVLYAQSSEAPRGVFRSTDDGATWTEVGSGTLISFVDAGEEGMFFGRSTGVYRSTDGGLTWVDHSSGLTGLTVQSLAIDSDGTVFAGTGGAGVFVRDPE